MKYVTFAVVVLLSGNQAFSAQCEAPKGFNMTEISGEPATELILSNNKEYFKCDWTNETNILSCGRFRFDMGNLDSFPNAIISRSGDYISIRQLDENDRYFCTQAARATTLKQTYQKARFFQANGTSEKFVFLFQQITFFRINPVSF